MDGPVRCTCGPARGDAPPDRGGVCPRCGGVRPSAESTRFFLASDPETGTPPPWFDAPTINYAAAKYTPPTGMPVPPTIPGYEILGELGRGGMGVVYRARQVSLNRTVALKMILAGIHAGPKDRERFRREAEAVAALQHPHIVQIFEIGEHNGQPYLALELVDGGTLADHLMGNPWPARDAALLVERLARTVQYAHDQGIVHRDLKPGNVLLMNDARGATTGPPGPTRVRCCPLVPKVTDFGLAKRLDGDPPASATGTGGVVGTPNYIAPEQAAGHRRVGPAVDVYALGAILYELLTGRPPFDGEGPLETVLQVIKTEPVPPARLRAGVPKDLETVCLACLQKNPARRYPSAAALADDLRRFLDGLPVYARPVSAAGRAARWARRHPALAGLGTTTVLATVALIAVLAVAYARVREAVRAKEQEAALAEFRRQDAERERERAEAEARRADDLRQQFQDLARRNESRYVDAEGEKRVLSAENDRAQRSIFALQLSQVAALCERDPARAAALLANPDPCPERLREFAWHYLRRQCDREEVVYDRHAGGLTAVAAAPDVPLVATADRGGPGDPAVRVWDPRTGDTWAVLAGAPAGVGGVAFAPTGGLVAAAGDDGTVRVWRLPAGLLSAARNGAGIVPPPPAGAPVRLDPVLALAAHPGGARCVAFAPDGAAFATGGADGAVRLWDAAADPPRPTARTLTGHAGPVLAVAYSPDGLTLATGGEDRTVRVWPLAGGEPRRLPPHADAVRAVAFSPDGRTLATADNGDDPVVRLWDAKGLKPLARLNGHTGAVAAVAFSPDGQLIASGGLDRAVRLWDAATGQDRGVLPGHEQAVRGIAFPADRRSVVSAAADRTARVWLARAPGPDAGSVTADAPVTAAGMSADGKFLVTGDRAGVTRVWLADATAPGRPVPDGAPTLGRYPLAYFCRNPHVSGPVTAVAVSPDGRYVAAAGDRGLGVIDLEAMSQTARGVAVRALLVRAVGFTRAVRDVAFSPDGRWLATAEESGVWVWDAHSGRSPHTAPVLPTEGARRVAFLPAVAGPAARGPLLAVAVGPGVQLVDLAGRTVADAVHRPDSAVTAVAVAPGGRRLATGDADGGVRVWEVTADGGGVQLAPVAEGRRHAEAVTALTFTRDGRTLVSGSRDRTAVLWDPITGQERATLTGHPDPLVGAAVLPGDAALVTVGRDGAVRRWRADPRKPDRVPPGFQLGVKAAPPTPAS